MTIIKAAYTADGHHAYLDDAGYVLLPNVGSRKISLAAGFALMGELELYATSEFLRAAEVMRRAHKCQWSDPLTYFRNIMNGKRLVLSMNAMGSVGAVTFRDARGRT